jgi:hypothetical protein
MPRKCIPRTCLKCGADFLTTVSNVNAGYGKYCGIPCQRAARPRRSPEERFWEKVRKTNGCWLWTGAADKFGYGSFMPDTQAKVLLKAPRYSWELHHGPVPEGHFVCHHCDNPACVRPDHLFIGTPADNSRDMATKERSGKKSLTARDVRTMRALRKKGLTVEAIGRRFGVGPSAASSAIRGRTWKHVQ